MEMQAASLPQTLLHSHGMSPMGALKTARPSGTRVALKKIDTRGVDNCQPSARAARSSARTAPRMGASKHVHVRSGSARRAFDNLENTDPSSAYGSTIFSVYPCKRCHALLETHMNHGRKITGVLQCTECSYQFCFHCELARTNVYGKGQRRCPEHLHAPMPGQEELQAAPTGPVTSKGRNASKEALKQRRSCRRLLSPKKRALKKRTVR